MTTATRVPSAGPDWAAATADGFTAPAGPIGEASATDVRDRAALSGAWEAAAAVATTAAVGGMAAAAAGGVALVTCVVGATLVTCVADATGAGAAAGAPATFTELLVSMRLRLLSASWFFGSRLAARR